MAIENERRKRIVPLQHHFKNAPRRRQVGVFQPALAVMRRVTGGVEQHIALAERQFERFR